MGISISGSNSVVEFLPSKQAVAGSSPVSRSLQYIVSLQALLTPVGNNQAVKRKASRRCFIVQKGVQRHPASQNTQHPAFTSARHPAPAPVTSCLFPLADMVSFQRQEREDFSWL